MPLDPLLMLAGKAPEIPDPLQVAGQQNQLKLQQEALQTGQLRQVGLGQENQMRAQSIDDDQNFRKLFAQSVQSGQPIPQAQIMQTLGPVRGAAYNKSMLDVAEAQSRLTAAKDKHTQAETDWAGENANALLKTVDPNTGLVDPHALANAVQQAHQLGYENEAQQLAGVANQDPKSVTRVLTQMVQGSSKQRTVNAQEDTAQARKDQAANSAARDKQLAGFEAERNRLDAERLANQEASQRSLDAYRQKLLQQGDTRLGQGQTRLDQGQQRIDNSPANNRATNGLTPGQNQSVYQKAQADEQKQDGLRQAIGNALSNGLYVKPDGSSVPFERMIPKQGANEEDDAYQARFEAAKSGLQKEMQARYRQATAAANAATARKNSALQAGGIDPDVSTEDAAAARGGTAAPSQQAAPQQAAQPQKPAGTAQAGPPAAIVSKMQVGKITTFANGQKWMKNADGTVKQVR